MSLLSSGAVTVADYRVQTNDQASQASAVSAALIEGQSLLEEHLRRHLENMQRTARFEIYMDGRVYPDAYPITAVPTVAPAVTIDGRSLWGAQPDTGPFIGIFEQLTPLRATVIWTGGYTPAGGIAPLPRTLADALYDLAKALLSFSDAPQGVSSVRVGDAQVSFAATERPGGLDSFVLGLNRRVKPYRNRFMAAGGSGVASRVLTP